MFKQQKIDKIIFTGQALRENFYTIKWIWELFAYYLTSVTGLPTFYIASQNDENEKNNPKSIKFDVSKFYNCYSINYSFDEFDSENNRKIWSQIYYNTEFNEKAYKYVYSIYKNSLVISFETENCINNILDYYNIEHLDINLDPIRFLDDVMLCFKSNNKKVYSELLKYKINEEILFLHANYIKAVYNLKNSFNNFDENNVLFLGQTICDKTLVDPKTNKIYSIINHKEEFLKSIEGFDNIYYKRHPYVSHDEEIIEFITSIKNIKIIDDNFYQLLSRPDIKKVVSISSGSCSEARYFGKEAQTLLQEGIVRQTKNNFDKNKYISVYGEIFSLNFWSDILRPIIKTKKYNKIYSIAKPDRFRLSKEGLYYAYENFNNTNVQQDLINYTNLNVEKSINYTNLKVGETMEYISNSEKTIKNNIYKSASVLSSLIDDL